MPNQSDLTEIANLLYDKPISASGTTNAIYNGKASELGFPEPYFCVWSGEENGTTGNNAYTRYFRTTNTDWNYNGRSNSNGLGLCLGE